MMLVRTYVAQSEIQGLGVFAGEFVPAGRQLWVLNPKFDIFVYANEIPMLDCDDGKFMNHRDRPNTDFHIFDRGHAVVDIAAGEEITCSYFEFDPDFRGFSERAIDLAISAMQAESFGAGADSRP
jgi:hypothetical protein